MNKTSQYIPGKSAIPGVSISPAAPVAHPAAHPSTNKTPHSAPHAPGKTVLTGDPKSIEELKREIESVVKVVGEHKDQLGIDQALSALQTTLSVSTDPLHAQTQDNSPASFNEVQLLSGLGSVDSNNKRHYSAAWDVNTTSALVNVCTLLEIVGEKMKDEAITGFAKNLKEFAKNVNTKASNIFEVAHSIATNLHAATGKIMTFVKTLPVALTDSERLIMRSNSNFKLDVPTSFYAEDGLPAGSGTVPVHMNDLRNSNSFTSWLRSSQIKIVNEEDSSIHPAADLPKGPAIVLNHIDSLLK